MLKKIQSFILPIFIFLIFLLGFFLRAQEVISGNYLFLLDQGRDMMDVKGIIFDHKLTLIGPYTSLGGVFQGPLYYYLLAIPLFIFNGDPWGAMLLMLLISMTTLGVCFFFMKKLFGIIPAVITLVLFAASPEAIAAATYIWNPHPMWLLLVVYSFLLFYAVQEKKWAVIVLWSIVALTFHFEIAFGVFLSIATMCCLFLFKRSLFQKKLFWVGVILGGIFFLPQILFDIRHDFLMSSSVLKIFQGQSQGLVTGREENEFFDRTIQNFTTLKNNYISTFIHEGKFWFLPFLILFITIPVFFYYSFIKKGFSMSEKLFLRILLFIIGFIWICSLFYPFPLRYWFLTGFQTFYILCMGLILGKLFQKKYGKIILIMILAVILYYSFFRLDTLYVHPLDDGGVAKIKGKLAAIDYIYEDANSKDFGVLFFAPPVLTDNYDYLIWWYGSRKYGYTPYSEKKGSVYLLIEPDSSNPTSYNGWLETVIKTGKVQSTKKLPSGFIIQKRIF